eukprot:869284-Karenia_brevis.AAC.1
MRPAAGLDGASCRARQGQLQLPVWIGKAAGLDGASCRSRWGRLPIRRAAGLYCPVAAAAGLDGASC